MSTTKLSTSAELDQMQRETFDYFLKETNLANGLVRDKTGQNCPSSIAVTGLGLASYPVAIERGYITREAAIERVLTTLSFFWNSHQGPEPNATGYKGFYYHFLDMETGRRAIQSELSTIDSTFLFAGMLTAAQYFDANTPKEQEIRRLADALYRRADWQWAQNQGETVTHGWWPESGFIKYRWEGFDEAMLLYVLGLGSPTYPLPESSYTAWTASYEWKNCFGYEYLYAGPLFTHQLSHIWIDFRNIQDAYMREKSSDYFENSRRATFVQREYAIQNPLNFVGYNHCAWGFTASEGPGPDTIKIAGITRQFFDYIARGVPYGPDDGTIAPWSAVTSLPFAPEIVLPAIDHFVYNLRLKEGFCYGFRSTFNQTYPEKSHRCGWVSQWHYGVSIGPVILMIENFQTGLLWKLMQKCPYIVNGLKRAGFSGGWLSSS